MQVAYRITPIPLDSSNPEQRPLRFDVRLVTVPEFSEGTVTRADMMNALAAHPVLGRSADQPIDAVAVPLAEWIASGRPAAVTNGIAISLKYSGAKPFEALREVLDSYLERPADLAVSPVHHDSRFDKLREQDFVDLNRLHDDLWLLRTHIYASVTERLAFTTSISAGPSSFDKARWVNNYVQSTALEVVFGDSYGVRLFANSPVSAAAARLKDGVKKIQDRLASSDAAVRAFVASHGLRRTSEKGDVTVSVSDPNVAIHAALKNALLSETCGISTSWHAVSAQPVTGDHVLFLQGKSFAQTSHPLVLHSTAFRRMGHTHPVSFVDISQPGKRTRTTNSALACLNDEQGNPRYRATAINAEVAIIQGTVLQFNNSLSNTAQPSPQQTGSDFTDVLDQRPPQLLSDEHRGVNEPECAGLTISAPTADLITPAALNNPQREALWPCLFLEDLWTGFRLDLTDSAEVRFSSVHHQVQEITLTGSSRKIKGPVEDVYEREQTAASPSARSTEIIRYVGMSSGQARDYLRFLGTEKRISPLADAPFLINVTDYSSATALRFGRLYCYRLRNVLMGGISLSAADADSLSRTDSFVQCCPFFRARAYKAGELVSANFSNSNDASRSIFLTPDAPDASVWVVPTPINMDTARYHGIFLSQKSEPARNAHRQFVQNVSHYFRRRPSDDLQYFFDPDVAAISVQVTVLNGDPDSTSQEFTYERDTFCELTPHMHLSPVRVEYGRVGRWEEFRPIELRFSISSGTHVEVTKHGRTVRIVAPVSAELEITILPELGKDQLRQTASYAASSAQLKLRATPSLADAASIVPAVAEQKLQVTHCAKAPTMRPFFGGMPVRFSPKGETVTVAERSRFKETADLPGYIQVDAASAGQVWLEAEWSDIEDRPWQDRPALTSARANSTPRSILFDKHSPPSASLMARVAMSSASLFMQSVGGVQSSFGFQCAENKIFLLNPPQPQSQQPSSALGRPCTLNFVDGRRKRANVTAVTSSRYKAQFKPGPASAFQSKSERILVDVPASMMLPAPDISHVVPISHDFVRLGGGTRRTQRIYAMRIYVRPPWLVSGPGERLAVGCRSGAAAGGPVSSLDKFVTQWGEDPIERPHLDVAREPPRMTDFQVPENGNTEPLDATFYPQRSIEGANEVLYLDNLSVADASLAQRTISVASFALRRDPTTKLWFCDVRVAGGFLGWCGLALYRHQPHSHEDLQLSATPAWVYGAILHGEQIVWVRGVGMLHVTVGPVFDRNTSFELDRTSYHNDVTRDLTRAAGTRVTLQQYESGRATYFEGIVKTADGPWSLIKRRFGSEVASISLHAGG
ncbi:hypothetical protein AWB70_02212 [Caballeronia cordobensis]|uniref:Uncharacterized protein n=1 Tax=Caballeronia cordobensis TaxID=1353886 RepID=A0A158GMN6_CABCO|nr:hypothetical protein [Caballeronia cordobensis]SAL33374.1 hypothetical protein AWB70_02212 [Caballeronia cordobensis]